MGRPKLTEEQKERRKELQKKYEIENKNAMKEYRREYNRNHKTEIQQRKKEYYLKNREEIIAKRKERYQKWKGIDTFDKSKIKHYIRVKSVVHKVPWELTNQEALKFFYQNCHYCGKPANKIGRNEIQRLDVEKAYTLTNCVTACTTCWLKFNKK